MLLCPEQSTTWPKRTEASALLLLPLPLLPLLPLPPPPLPPPLLLLQLLPRW